jgi:HNH endonuclease
MAGAALVGNLAVTPLLRPCVLVNDKDWYGKFYRFGRSFQMHRVVYQFVSGVIPPWVDVDHLCSQKACIEVTHLEAVSKSENVRRSWARRERSDKRNQYTLVTHCIYGHAFTPENTKLERRSGGKAARRCRECERRRKRECYARSRGRVL